MMSRNRLMEGQRNHTVGWTEIKVEIKTILHKISQRFMNSKQDQVEYMTLCFVSLHDAGNLLPVENNALFCSRHQ